MNHLRATSLEIPAKEVPKAVRRRTQHLENAALQLAEAGRPLFGRLATAQTPQVLIARFDG
jgi:hypothetical protein